MTIILRVDSDLPLPIPDYMDVRSREAEVSPAQLSTIAERLDVVVSTVGAQFANVGADFHSAVVLLVDAPTDLSRRRSTLSVASEGFGELVDYLKNRTSDLPIGNLIRPNRVMESILKKDGAMIRSVDG